MYTLEDYDLMKARTEADLIPDWHEISAEDADYLLEVLPPVKWQRNAFMAGEALTCGVDGRIFEAVCTVGAKHYSRPAYLAYFNPEEYTKQIMEWCV